MLKKTIKYTDFNGREVTEDFYFNLSKAEVAEMEIAASTLNSENEISGGMEKLLTDVISSGSGQRIIDIFKEIIVKSYGLKSEDGKRFVKSKELSNEFLQTAAFSEFFVELLTDPEAAANFVKGVMPIEIPDAEIPKPIPAQQVIDSQGTF